MFFLFLLGSSQSFTYSCLARKYAFNYIHLRLLILQNIFECIMLLTVCREIYVLMTISRRINFDESIPRMIERLKTEHIVFESKLVQIENSIKMNNIKLAAQIVQDMGEKIIQHAVEEEARLMRVIMKNAKDESSESIEIMQEHNWLMNFLNNRLMLIKNAATSSDPAEYEEAKRDLDEFVDKLRKHFKEEEEIVFPLTLRSQSPG